MRRVLFVSVSLSLLAACGGLDEDHEPEAPPDESEIDTQSQGLIDCSARTDTGYRNGSAFRITVVTVDGKPVERDTANAYYVMQQAAARAGVRIAIVSGFRTMAQQQYLYNCYIHCSCNNCNLAARPGYSNHQSGHALDLNTSSGGVLSWLNNNGARFGFRRTVSSEPWHWEWWGGGPGGGPCGAPPPPPPPPMCNPHCEGNTIVGRDCGRGNCAAYGATCVDDRVGVRCASVFCPAIGTADVCVNDTTAGHCVNGAISTGDCSAYGAYCARNASPPRCISAFCIDSPADRPHAKQGCFPDGRKFSCDAHGAITVDACPSGQKCSVYPTLHCEAGLPCPPSGEAYVCVDPGAVGRCYGGGVVSFESCAAGQLCKPGKNGAPARCAPDDGMPPGDVPTMAALPPPAPAVLGDDVPDGVVPDAPLSLDGPNMSVEAPHEEGDPTLDEPVAEDGTPIPLKGPADGIDAATGGCGCAASASASEPASAWLLLGLAALTRRMYRSRARR